MMFVWFIMKSINIITILLICTFAFLMAEEAEDKMNVERPKIGLVLSGGGARGIAHIGVLKVLEEIGIEPDYITGTSMGSVIGALYAIGYRSEQLEEIVLEQDWDVLLMDKIFRKDVSIEEKKYDERYIGKLPIVKYKIVLPAGLVGGQRISKLFSDLTISAQYVNDFNKLRTPFRCIATDIETGEAVVLDSGFLPEAMRTSMSIPSAFTPVKESGKLLVDGGLSRNLPAIDAIEMGADIIIAVDVSSKLYKKEQLNSLVKIMEQSVNFRGLERSKKQHELCDLIIFPEVEDYGLIDFDNCESLIQLGEIAARESYDKLQTIADEQKQYTKEEKGYPVLEVDKLFIKKVHIKGLKTVSKNLVIGKLNIKEDSWVTMEKLSKAIDRLYGSQFFERVSYRLIRARNSVELEIRVIEKYKHSLNFSFQYNSETKAAILLNETLRNALIPGSRLIWDIRLSENPGHALSYFVHTGWKPGFGIGVETESDQFEVPVQVNTGIDHYEYSFSTAKLIIQTVFSNNIALGIGIGHEFNDFKSIDRDPVFEFVAEATKLCAFLEYDTLNRTIFPQSGMKISGSFSSYPDPICDLDSFEYDPFSRTLIDIEGYKKLHERVSLTYGYSAGFIYGDPSLIPPNYYLYLGGIGKREGTITFLGEKRMANLTENAAVFRFGFQYNFWKGFYFIPNFNLGSFSDDDKELFSEENVFAGVGITFALKTPFGSIESTSSISTLSEVDMEYVSVGFKF